MRSSLIGLVGEGTVLVMIILAPSLILLMIVSDLLKAPSASLTVEGLCCNHTAWAAERRFERIDGVVSCSANRESQSLLIELDDADMATFNKVWEEAKLSSLRPISLRFRGVDVFEPEIP